MTLSTPPAEQDVSRLIAGSFRIKRVIGRGSYATCYIAEQMGTDRNAVIKVAHEHLIRGDLGAQVRDRFAAELKASTRVNHPNIATVFTWGETEEGLPYIAMEYVPGQTLEAFLEENAPLDRRLVGKLFGQILSALAAVHKVGVVHRDVTPYNIMITPALDAKLLDFGIARLETGSGHTMGPLGTPRYMAPEQIEGTASDRSDLFSFGCILWWAITGKEYLADIHSTGQLLSAQLRAVSAPDPREIRSSIPEPMAKTIMALLHPNGRRRPNADRLLELWDRLIAVWESVERPDGSNSGHFPAASRSSVSSVIPTPAPTPAFQRTGTGPTSAITRPKTGSTRPLSLKSARSIANAQASFDPDASHLRAMVLGKNRQLRSVVELNLSSLNKGVEVVTCMEQDEAMIAVGGADFDVFICCLPFGGRDDTSATLRALRRVGVEAPMFVLGFGRSVPAELLSVDNARYFSMPGGMQAMKDAVLELEARRIEAEKPQLLDPQAIQALRAAGNLANVVEFVIGTMPEWLSEIEEALQEGDHYLMETLSRHVERHARSIGALTLIECARNTQHMARHGSALQRSSSVEELELAFHEIFRELLKIRQEVR